MGIHLLIGGLGLLTGFLSGLLGIGGGIIMAPLLLYVPAWFGLAPLPMRVVAGLTIIQGLTACLAGALTHRKFNFVSGQLTIWMGTTIFITALTGGAAAKYAPNALLLSIFALLAILASGLILVPGRADSDNPRLADLTFSRPRAVISAGAVGLLGGLVGQGGSFILIPLMTSYLKVPTRIALGSNLAIVSISSLAAFIGKAANGQIAWPLAIPVIATVVPAAWLGSLISRRVPVAGIRLILAACIALAAVRISLNALGY